MRPANYLESNPGRGHTVIEKDGVRWGVVNLSGTVFIDAAHSPFHVVDRLLAQLQDEADLVIVDFHAEATSEKVAMGWHLDGRVLAVFGTHTHVPTADGRVLPKRDRLHLGRRHDRRARRRDRRQEGAGHRALPDRRCRSGSRPPTKTRG